MHTPNSLPPIPTTPHEKIFSIEWECFWGSREPSLGFQVNERMVVSEIYAKIRSVFS